MNRVFGKAKAKKPTAAPPSLTDASASAGKRVDDLDSKITKLDSELRVYKDKMKTCKGSAKQLYQKRAMDVLKRKRMYEKQREQVMGQQFNIDQASFGIESAKDTVTTVAAMKNANTQLKSTITEIGDIDDIYDITDDMADLMEDMDEVNNVLASNYATPDDIDEADLEAELDLLEDEFETEADADATPSYLQDDALPAQPTSAPGEKLDIPQAPTGLGEDGLPMRER